MPLTYQAAARTPLSAQEKKLIFQWEAGFAVQGGAVFANLASSSLASELGASSLSGDLCARLRSAAAHQAARHLNASFLVGVVSAKWPDGEKSILHHSPVSGVSLMAQPFFGALQDGRDLGGVETVLRVLGSNFFESMTNAPVACSGSDGEPFDNRRPMLLALEAGDNPELIHYLASVCKSDFVWNDPGASHTALNLAAALGRTKSIEVLLAAGALPNSCVWREATEAFISMPPALEAAKHGQWEALKRLAPLRFYNIAQDKDAALLARARLDSPEPRPLSSVENAKIWLHSVATRVRVAREQESTAALLAEARRLAQAPASAPALPEPDPRPKSFFSRLALRKAKAADAAPPPTPEQAAGNAFLAALAQADWGAARASLDFLGELGAVNLRRAGRPVAFLAMALALAALDQDGAESAASLSERPLSRTGRIEPLAPYLSRPGRASLWQQLLSLPDDSPLGKSIRAGFFEPDPAADGMRQVHWFALFNQPSGIEALARAGADIVCDSALDDAPSPIALAARAGCVEAMETLARLGAPLESERTSVLLSAAENGEEAVFERAAELLLAQSPERALWASERLDRWLASRPQEAQPWVARRVEALQLAASARMPMGAEPSEEARQPARRPSAHRL